MDRTFRLRRSQLLSPPSAVTATIPHERSLLPTTLTEVQKRRGQRLMLHEGAVWSVMNALTTGTILTAFALALHANAFVLGLLGALPLAAALFQLTTPSLVARIGSRRVTCVLTLGTARLLLFPLALIAAGFGFWPDLAPLWLGLTILVITLGAGFTAIGGTAWLNWASLVVPVSRRAGYFARRNMINAAIGLISTLAAGVCLDTWQQSDASGASHPQSLVFVLLFLLAAVCGLITVDRLRRTPDLTVAPVAARPQLRAALAGAWQYRPLRRYITFSAIWQFGLGLAGPYYTVYMLQNLHLRFAEANLLLNIGALAGLVSGIMWGRLSERFGHSRVLHWVSAVKVAYVVAWAFLPPDQAFWLIFGLMLTLAVDAGWALCAVNVLMSVVSESDADPLGGISLYTAANSAASAAGSLIAGGVISAIAATQVTVLGLSFGAIPLIFLASGFARLVAMAFFRGFSSPAESAIQRE